MEIEAVTLVSILTLDRLLGRDDEVSGEEEHNRFEAEELLLVSTMSERIS